MKLRFFGMLAAVSVAALALGAQPAAAGPKAKNKGKSEEATPSGPAKMKGKLGLAPKGLAWGVSLEAVAKAYDKVFNDEFVPLYKKAQPGVQMEALDAELADKKQLIRRNKILFGNLPTGVDQSALKPEYTYNNKESMSKLTLRSGVTRNFFFFDDKLWKIYDEHKLRKGGPYGETWEEALEILSKKYGAEPFKIEADYSKGRNFDEAQWQDGTTVIRAVNRQPVIGLVYQDASVYFNLAKYRTHKATDVDAMDKDVAAATAKPSEPPKTDDSKTKGKRKGKGK